MGFIQFIQFETDDIDPFLAEVQRWEEESGEWRTATRGTLCADRDNPGSYVQVVEFPSFEEAMKNSNDPRTNEFAERIAAITKNQIFRNLDVLKVSEF